MNETVIVNGQTLILIDIELTCANNYNRANFFNHKWHEVRAIAFVSKSLLNPVKYYFPS